MSEERSGTINLCNKKLFSRKLESLENNELLWEQNKYKCWYYIKAIHYENQLTKVANLQLTTKTLYSKYAYYIMIIIRNRAEGSNPNPK